MSDSDSVGLGEGLEFCVFEKFPGATAAADPQATLRVGRV